MAHQSSKWPDHPIEEWTDTELIDQYRYVQAETADLPIRDEDNSPVDAIRQELRRRGLESAAEDTEGDAASPGRESTDQPHRSA